MSAVKKLVNSDVEVQDKQETKAVYFANNIGITVSKNDALLNNPAIIEHIESLSDGDTTIDENSISFHVRSDELAYLLHKAYCHVDDGHKIQVEFDGLFPFDAPDENGVNQSFNAQLVTIRDIVYRMH